MDGIDIVQNSQDRKRSAREGWILEEFTHTDEDGSDHYRIVGVTTFLASMERFIATGQLDTTAHRVNDEVPPAHEYYNGSDSII